MLLWQKGREAVDIIYKKNTQKNISAKHHYIMRMEYEPELIVRNSTGKCKTTNKIKRMSQHLLKNMTLVCMIFIHSVRYHIIMINVYESQIRRAHGQQTSK